MKEIYQIAKFKLNSLELKDEWKKMSKEIGEDMAGTTGLIFRDSTIDEEGNVQCILKWESEEAQKQSEEEFQIMCKEQPEIMDNFGKLANMSTMTEEILNVI